MKQDNNAPRNVVILSGKGGTGKTSVSAAFAHLFSVSKEKIIPIVVDADVDAANLSLVLQPKLGAPREFWGGGLAELDSEKCNACGLCWQVCRYDAIIPPSENNPGYAVDKNACDGCAACMYACPTGAIKMNPQQEGLWFHSNTPYGELFHAELFPGRENSGKLVTLIKQNARLLADEVHADVIIVDGPPGIGCPVIAACAGAHLGLVVTEPGLSALHDMKRVLTTLQHFHIPVAICINKADLYLEGVIQIHEFADEQGIIVLGEIPFDESIPISMLDGVPVTAAFEKSPAAVAIKNIWVNVCRNLFKQEIA